MGKTSDAIAAVSILIQSRVPGLLLGEPGCGKTANIQAICDALGEPLETVMLSIREPADIGGWPVKTDLGVMLDAPAWAKRLAHHGHGCVFFDELTTAAPAMQAAGLRVIHEGVVGDVTLPHDVSRMAAANPPDQAGGAGNDLSAPLSNRFIHLQWPHGDVEAWSSGMVSGWPEPEFPRLPPNWQAQVPYMRAKIASFIHARPELLHKLPKEESQRSEPWPSERSWDMSATVMAAATVASENVRTMLLAGGVGPGPAMEYLTYEAHLDLPDPEECLANPERVKVPKQGDKAYALFAGVASAVIANFTEDRYHRAFKVFAKAAESNAPDLAVSSAGSVVKYVKNNVQGLREHPAELERFWGLFRDSGLLASVA